MTNRYDNSNKKGTIVKTTRALRSSKRSKNESQKSVEKDVLLEYVKMSSLVRRKYLLEQLSNDVEFRGKCTKDDCNNVCITLIGIGGKNCDNCGVPVHQKYVTASKLSREDNFIDVKNVCQVNCSRTMKGLY